MQRGLSAIAELLVSLSDRANSIAGQKLSVCLCVCVCVCVSFCEDRQTDRQTDARTKTPAWGGAAGAQAMSVDLRI